MRLNLNPDLVPGIFVINENNNDWGIGQIQSSIDNKITINFENVGKKVINSEKIKLKVLNI
jgi:hypothetical protein|tara:strand:+ start:355 stop:537 length:183 start_codon:yes stop_codon:yes gene_type:complete